MSQELRKLAIDASTRAHSPYSNAKVGSAIETHDGKIYQGCNIENASFGGTVCAERVAIWKAVSEGHKRMKRIYVYTHDGWPPCGMCLQVMTEFADGNLEITFGDHSGKETTKRLNELLTNAFTPTHME
jgi:cytidine deaminase